jgi:hypothetical protein
MSDRVLFEEVLVVEERGLPICCRVAEDRSEEDSVQGYSSP